MGHYFDSAHLFRPSYQCLLLAFLQDDVLIHMNFNCNISVIQWYIKCNNGLLCPVMAGTGHQDYWCSQRGQRQCQVPLQSREVLWSSLQQWPCKNNTFFKERMNCCTKSRFNVQVHVISCTNTHKLSFLFHPGFDGGCNSRSDQCHQDDSQYFSLLQHIRKDYIAFC